jgi:hypothetical protein
MSSATKSPPRRFAVLKLPEYEVPRLIVYAEAIVGEMTGNAWFPDPTPPCATVEAAIHDLSNAETVTLTRTKGAVAARDAKRIALVMLLQRVLSYVQATADAHRENAASIIESAGVAVKKPRVLPARVFAAKPGPVSGSVKLVAPKAGHRAGYEWAYSIDGGETWISAPFTVQASTTISGLKPASTVHFKYRPVTKDGGGDWSQTVAIIVD